MITALLRVVDYFVPAPLAAQARDLYRCRLFVGICFALIFIVIASQLFSIGMSGLPSTGVSMNLLFTVPIQAGLLAAIWYLRQCARYELSVNIALAILFLVLVCVVALLGGPLGGVSVVMLFVPPMLGFVLQGMRAGLIWTGLAYLAMVAGSVVALSGFEFPNIDQTPTAAVGQMIHLHVSFFAIFSLFAFYEYSNSHYRKQLEYLARHDNLTELPNRAAFYRKAEDYIEAYRRNQTPFTLIFIDLDNFKAINDAHGHVAGDQVLRAFAKKLKASVRAQDYVCRLGGDEFAVLLHDAVDERIAQAVLTRLRKQMSQPIDLRNGQRISVEASTGLAFYPRDARSLEDVLHAADQRMYERKQRDGSGVAIPA